MIAHYHNLINPRYSVLLLVSFSFPVIVLKFLSIHLTILVFGTKSESDFAIIHLYEGVVLNHLRDLENKYNNLLYRRRTMWGTK